MDREDYIGWVEQAARGDLDAFSRLVDAFQDLATGAAFGWLGDLESARDVSQESFLDAYAHLSDLRDPAAFPAWLRRIVIKHCDRLTRRRAMALEPMEPDLATRDATTEDQAIRNQQASDLRLAVSGLPPQERIVVALSYFAELSGTEAAEFLDLPLSTIKKRLRSARARLRRQGEDMMQESLHPLRPSRSGTFAELVNFFVAIRGGDHARVRDLLHRSPGLVDAVQEWEPELVWEGVLPFASRATALITAIERNDLVLLKLLLDAGASVDGLCECATGESPVWAATVLDRPLHLHMLLERGADPNRPSTAGSRPLHVAAMRGHREAAELLLSHGADPKARDRQGLVPEDWARSNGHLALARRLAPGLPHVAQPRARSLSVQSIEYTGPVLFTGIKALDLFCPLPRGGVVRIPFMAGVGMMVLIGELCERIARSPAGRALWTGFTQPPFDVTDWRTEMAELGILTRVEHSLGDLDAPADARREAFHNGLERAMQLREQGFHVLMVLLSRHGFEGDVEAVFPGLLETGAQGSITTLVITPFPECPEASWPRPAPPYCAQLRLDRHRARRGLFPAVHPGLTWSRALRAEATGTEHIRVADAARDLLIDYAKYDPQFLAIEKAAVTDPHFASLERVTSTRTDTADAHAMALLDYLSQTFYVAEPFTGRPGEWVTQETLLKDVKAILAG